MLSDTDVTLRLQTLGFIERVDAASWRTTRRWQAAMARAAKGLYEQGAEEEDPRLPIVHAFFELLGPDVADEELVSMVAAMLPIELRSQGILP